MTGHPIRSAITRIDETLKDVRDVPAWSMAPAETRDAMVEITRLNAAMAELEARLAAHGQTVEVEADSGATSTAQLVGARNEADPRRCAPQDQARERTRHPGT